MPSVYIEDALQTTEIECAQPLPANATELLAISSQLALLNQQTPLKKFTLKLPAGAAEYLYEIELKDGRVFKQKLRTNGSVEECEMSFNVPDFWKVKEFIPHRVLRNNCLNVILQYGVTKLIVVFV